MKKSFIVIMLFLISAMSYADFNGEAGVGMAVLDIGGTKSTAMKLNFTPELAIGEFSMGFRVRGYFDGDGLVDFNNDKTKDIKDLELGFRYIQFENNIFKARYGNLDNFTLGHGSLVGNYSNNEKTSLDLGIQYPEVVGIEVMFPLKKDIFGVDIKEEEQPKLIAGRGYVRPLKMSKVIELPIINNLEFGITYAKDIRDNFGEIELLPEINNSTTSAIVTSTSSSVIVEKVPLRGKVEGMTYEISMPIIEKMVIPYYDFVKVNGEINGSKGEGTGSFIGIMGKVSILDYKFELRNFSGNLTPSYFGQYYEAQSLYYLNRLVYGKKDNISGYFGNAGFELGGIAIFRVNYEDYFNSNLKPHVFAKLDIFPNDKKLNSSLTYEQINIGDKPGMLNENTIIKARIKAPSALIGIPGPFSANINIEQTYYYDEGKKDYEPRRAYGMTLGLDW